MATKRKVVWATVRTTDYYGAFEEAVIKDGTSRQPDRNAVVMNITKPRLSIRVRWPNGKTTKERLVVRNGNDSAQIDMNNCPDEFPTQQLVVVRVVNGVKVDVPLTGLEITTL